LFIRFRLTITPPLPPDAMGAAQAKGRERYDKFIVALARPLNQSSDFFDEITLAIVRADRSPEDTVGP
jgi:hypothetical protein